MDGNGRWAKSKGRLRIQGHKAGVDSVRDTIESCAQLGVQFLTLYAFSTENWRRPKSEIGALMKLLIQTLRQETQNLNDNDIRIQAIGQIDRLPEGCKNELLEAMKMTEENQRMVLTLALSYSGRWDMTQAIQAIAEQVKSGEIDPEQIDEDLINRSLVTRNMPDPDLLIRTGGEYRVSNFLLWQSAYTEFFITHKYWPDFRRDDLYDAIEAYQTRERRFGMISEQICRDEKEKADASV